MRIPPETTNVAEAFVKLQQARQDADYAVHRVWSRRMALVEVDRAEQAFKDWKKIRPRGAEAAQKAELSQDDLHAGYLFLAWLLFRNKLQGRK